MAIKAVKFCGLKDNLIYRSLKKIKDVNGRLELARKFHNGVKVYIDFAHTPDALIKTLKSLKSNYGNNISLVFGCGGERDQKKRSLMAKIANNYCKKIYITDDNPRNENPKKIRNDLLKHVAKEKAFDIGNRKLAVQKAIQNAHPNEIILIAGKGHEEQQIYKNKILNISDKKIIENIHIKNKNLNKRKKNYASNRLILENILGKVKILDFNGLSIDTRSIKKDDLFLTIKGKKKNGDKFINEALKKEAGCVITSSKVKNKNKKILKVKNTISFLNQFAKLKRDRSSSKIIAVTGSAGKTSFKNLIHQLLVNFGKTYSSPKSFNNHLGVPISLSNLSTDDKFGIFEVGMSKSGEIKKLSKLIKPHLAVITNIGEAHIENFKNIYGIAKAKSEIIENIEPEGTVILNRDDKFFNFLSKKAKDFRLKISTFGKNKESNIHLIKIIKKNDLSKIYLNIDGPQDRF
jgi:murE/murF fusion protein